MQFEYAAQLSDDGSQLVGKFKQAGREFDLIFDSVELDAPAPEVNRPQNPEGPFPYTANDVSYKNENGGHTLAGTLTIPEGEGPFPVAIMISGSGGQDRDETLRGHKPFLVIADHLSRNGIAVLRFDDRGIAASTGDHEVATSADFATDVQAGIDFLKTQTEIDSDKIGLIGHSEGGLIAPMVAAQGTDVDFIVMMAGPGVNGEEILKSQTGIMSKFSGRSDAYMQAQEKVLVAVVEKMRSHADVTTEQLQDVVTESLSSVEDEELREMLTTDMTTLSATINSPWMRYFIDYDPATCLKQLKCPVLALNGSKDVQVLPKLNLEAIKAAVPSDLLTPVELKDMNHLFQETDGTGMPNEYPVIEQTFSPKALDLMTAWIQSHTK